MKKNPYDELIKPWIYTLDEPKKTIEVKHGYEKQGQILLTRLSKQYQEFEGWSVKL